MNILTPDAADFKKLAAIRSKIVSIDDKLAKVKNARLPRAEIERRVRTELAEFSHTAGGTLGPLAYTEQNDHLAPNIIGDLMSNPRGLALILGDLMLPAIVDAAEAAAGDESAISIEDRENQIEKLRAERQKLERQEEIEVLALEHRGWTVGRRPDINVGILLDAWEELSDGDAGEAE